MADNVSNKSRTHASSHSRSSSRSSAAAAAAIAKAKAAKTRLAYIDRELRIKMEMEKLQAEREAAVAEAEAEAFIAIADQQNERSSRHRLKLDSIPFDPNTRVREYLADQASQPKQEVPEPQPLPNEEFVQEHRYDRSHTQKQLPPLRPGNLEEPIQTTPPVMSYHSPNPHVEGDEPHDNWYPSNTRDVPQSRHATDFMRYLTRRELFATGLPSFDDRPESYRAWKRSFQAAIRHLGLPPNDEMDMLVKRLGKESKGHAERLRSAHLHHPERGLQRIWARLEECYGAPEMIEEALFKRIDDFPRLSADDFPKLRELSDLATELLSAKEDGDLPSLAFLDTARGLHPFIAKLPSSLQDAWLCTGSEYKERHRVMFPPFEVFVSFIAQQARIRNDPSFKVNLLASSFFPQENKQRAVSVNRTEVSPTISGTAYQQANDKDLTRFCPLHKRFHSLLRCRTFRQKALKEREAFIKDNGICFKCCLSTTHIARFCKADVKCDECDSREHNTALHPGPLQGTIDARSDTENGGESKTPKAVGVISQCTQVCGGNVSDKSCSKICLVNVYPANQPDQKIKMYAIIDEQSNRSLACSEFFCIFKNDGPSFPYSLKTCAGVTQTTGRRATGFQVESLDGRVSLPLPSLVECNQIPDDRSSIPTPEAALHQPHLKKIAHLIPTLEPQTPIMLLLGRDILRVHKVRQQINGPGDAPYAQRLDLGWVIVGDVCLGRFHPPTVISAMHTNIADGGRPTLFELCPNNLEVRETYDVGKRLCPTATEDRLFQWTRDDERMAPSIEDIVFLNIMERQVMRDCNHNWVAPLPFKAPRRRLPHNRILAEKRFTALVRNLERRPDTRRHFLSFMGKLFENGHAERAPPCKEGEECWYLPFFGVYHPKKPEKIRVVFDSSAKHDGISLNDVLISGPDLNNTLIGVLSRFRIEPIAIMADIEQMFHCFLVKEEHRNYLRFLWYQENDPHKKIAEYRMRVHVFGNSPSPAIAIYCLRQAVKKGLSNYDPAVEQLVSRNFYIDDCLKSFATEEEAISLLRKTRSILAQSNLRLHKIASNSRSVMTAFPPTDHASVLKDLDLGADELPSQRSLGLEWDIGKDMFTFKVPTMERPFTRRGVLSTLNSLYDPLGFAAPVTIQGKFILRELTDRNTEWDAPLPQEMYEPWSLWRDSLKALNELLVPRIFTTLPPSKAARRELHIFSDASTKAIAAVAYLRVIDNKGDSQIGFIMGKAKLAPRPEHSVPRLELCAALLATELSELISSEIDLQLHSTTFYTDSKIVLGYIHNETRRFYVYVSNRVLRIRRSSHPNQWRHVHTDQNPADLGTRSVPASHLQTTTWLNGPNFPILGCESEIDETNYNLINPDTDADVRPQVFTLITSSASMRLGSLRFERFSTWLSITRALANLIHIVRTFHQAQATTGSGCCGWHYCPKTRTVEELLQSKNVIIRAVQEEIYSEELLFVVQKKELPKSSPLKDLNPFIDSHGLLRIGGRASKADIETKEKHPIIIPGKHHVGSLIVGHYHGQTRHQGRLFTEGAIRTAGYWMVGGKRCVSRYIHRCVTCRKLRKPTQTQKMADLPADRLSTGPPFTYIGLDVFGPWTVSSRRTRGGLANSKRWAVMFTCMSTRGIHIEVIESMTASSLINALRRFFAIRGPAKHIRSDCGTNFVGACKELGIESNTDISSVTQYLTEQECTWSFNPPHAPHMGGAWERMIGIAKRILDAMFLQYKDRLTHELLITFLAEVTSIINARPLVPVSSDPDEPLILTPAILLTQKTSIPLVHECGFGPKDILRSQWKFVQHLAETFWNRWRREYLSSIQARTKWRSEEPNLELGNVVLLKDDQAARNRWPLGLITRVFPSEDNLVRKVEVKISTGEGFKLLRRPITEIVLLCAQD